MSTYPADLVAARRRLQQLQRELTAALAPLPIGVDPTEAWTDRRGREHPAHDGWPAGTYKRVEALREQIRQTSAVIGANEFWSSLSGEALVDARAGLKALYPADRTDTEA